MFFVSLGLSLHLVFTVSLSFPPPFSIHFSAAANSYLRKYDDVIQDCLKAVSIDPKFAKAYARLGSAYEELDQFDDAINGMGTTCWR